MIKIWAGVIAVEVESLESPSEDYRLLSDSLDAKIRREKESLMHLERD